jgi:hypothetical protein
VVVVVASVDGGWLLGGGSESVGGGEVVVDSEATGCPANWRSGSVVVVVVPRWSATTLPMASTSGSRTSTDVVVVRVVGVKTGFLIQAPSWIEASASGSSSPNSPVRAEARTARTKSPIR